MQARHELKDTGKSTRYVQLLFCLGLGSQVACGAGAGEPAAPEPIAATEVALGAAPPLSILPVFLVPKGQTNPSTATRKRLMDHVNRAQDQYRVLLKGRIPFSVAVTTPVIVTDTSRTAAQYLAALDIDPATGNAVNPGMFLERLFTKYAVDRLSNPYVYVIVPIGVDASTWGQPINGGINSGGGIVVLRPTDLNSVNVQSTLQHELGHAFGLLHSFEKGQYNGYAGVSAPPSPPPANLAEPPECASPMAPCMPHAAMQCRFSVNRGWTIMSYNPCHQTTEMAASLNPGELLPEDLSRLALNQGVFPNLAFNPETDKAASYPLQEPIWFFPPLVMTSQISPVPTVSTAFGEDYGSKVFNVVAYTIRKSNPQTPFDPITMWHSAGVNESGWASLTVSFPKPTTLDTVSVHTQHSGQSHAADTLNISAGNPAAYVTEEAIAVDDSVRFSATTAKDWTFSFHSNSGYVVVRGLRFFSQGMEYFPHQVPLEQNTLPLVVTTSGEAQGSKVSHVVVDSIPANNAATGFLPTRMWHSTDVGVNHWATLDVIFPYPITLDAVTVSSQHSGLYHAAQQIKVSYLDPVLGVDYYSAGTFGGGSEVTGTFPAHISKRWRLSLLTGSGYIVIRGLRFHTPVATNWAERPDCITGP
jgi:hypothetical protein